MVDSNNNIHINDHGGNSNSQKNLEKEKNGTNMTECSLLVRFRSVFLKKMY